VAIGHVFLQPGEWGRFKGLPVRKDVVEGMREAGITVLRYGGSMVNIDGYRWKKMIGPRDRRPGYTGTWYEHSSNGWGIIDFLNLCEAMGVLGVPDLSVDETPQDMADFVEYVNSPADSEWGKRRAADGHPEPYKLKHIELGNEEAVDEAYRVKFEGQMEAIWRKDPAIIPVVGDFEFRQVIADPYNFKGAPRVTSLAAHEKILKFAVARQKAVWFDFHVWNGRPGECRPHLAALASVAGWFEKLAPGADFKICVFEENATNHMVRRALAHAETINGLMRLGARVPIVCAANGLQVDGQNDNGWDQGLVFMNPSKVWTQPPGYVTRMVAADGLRDCVEVEGGAAGLDVLARVGADRKVLAVQVVNTSDRAVTARVMVDGFTAAKAGVRVTQIAGRLEQVNTAGEPEAVAPVTHEEARGFGAEFTFPARSFTVLRAE
jgi:alpha-L-arabinofuranosidase